MRHQQQHTNSCGAVALMCAAAELGVTIIPRVEGGPLPGGSWDGGPFLVTPRIENALYWVTSGYTMSNYSMPDNVVSCARRLGLHAEIYRTSTVAMKVLEKAYPSALEACKLKNISIVSGAPPPLETNQRELRVLSTFVVGLHYVMRRPEGDYMDPADGRDYQSWNALNTWEKCYQHTGLSIVLTANEVSGEEVRRLFDD